MDNLEGEIIGENETSFELACCPTGTIGNAVREKRADLREVL